jgi:hypothetical protein
MCPIVRVICHEGGHSFIATFLGGVITVYLQTECPDNRFLPFSCIETTNLLSIARAKTPYPLSLHSQKSHFMMSLWEWFFPHLCSPLCTDMVNIEECYEKGDEEFEVLSL